MKEISDNFKGGEKIFTICEECLFRMDGEKGGRITTIYDCNGLRILRVDSSQNFLYGGVSIKEGKINEVYGKKEFRDYFNKRMNR